MDQERKSQRLTAPAFQHTASGEPQLQVRITVPRVVPAHVRTVRIPVAGVAQVRVDGFWRGTSDLATRVRKNSRGAQHSMVI